MKRPGTGIFTGARSSKVMAGSGRALAQETCRCRRAGNGMPLSEATWSNTVQQEQERPNDFPTL